MCSWESVYHPHTAINVGQAAAGGRIVYTPPQQCSVPFALTAILKGVIYLNNNFLSAIINVYVLP